MYPTKKMIEILNERLNLCLKDMEEIEREVYDIKEMLIDLERCDSNI